MLTFESYGGAIQRGQSLQSLARDLVIVAIASSIRMQHQYAAPIGLLEFGQLAIGLYAKNSVEVKEIGFTSQVHTPLGIRPVVPWQPVPAKLIKHAGQVNSPWSSCMVRGPVRDFPY